MHSTSHTIGSRYTRPGGHHKSSINNQNILSTPQHFQPSRLPNASSQFTPDYPYTPPPQFALPMGANGSMLPVSPMNVSYSPFDTSGVQQIQHTTQIERMRLWRHDAFMQHLYETAAFWGDKVMSITGDANDVFWLAQVYYQTGEYTRAEHLLMSPSHHAMQSVACRYLASQCLVKLQKFHEALEVLGEKNPFHGKGNSGPNVKNTDGGIKLEASMCYLRGVIYTNLGNNERAKLCFKEALTLDVKCSEAFEALVKSNMMTLDEEWEFINGLSYNQQADTDSELIKLSYISRLRKYKNAEKIKSAMNMLCEKYKMSSNADIILSRADLAFTYSRFDECLELISRILEVDPYNFNALPMHIACMHELKLKNRLFLLSHDLSERYPEKAVSWFAVGVYYFTIGKNLEARRYFSKSSIMDPQFGPAWVGFAHTFAVEGEHEQAISAYSTANRLFQGTHLPMLYIGMQYLQQNNITLADEYLADSYRICTTDPLLLNEIGTSAYTKGMYTDAISMFEAASKRLKSSSSSQDSLASVQSNLGHAFRRLGQFDEARQAFAQARLIIPKDASIISALGLMLHLEGDLDGAITKYHQAQSLDRNDAVTSELLRRCLEENSEKSGINWSDLPLQVIQEARELVDFIPTYEPVDLDSKLGTSSGGIEHVDTREISHDESMNMSVNMLNSPEVSGISEMPHEKSSARGGDLFGRFQAALAAQDSSIIDPGDLPMRQAESDLADDASMDIE